MGKHSTQTHNHPSCMNHFLFSECGVYIGAIMTENIIKHFTVGWASLVTARVFTVCNNSNNNNNYNNNFMN